jgi:uridine kinase
MKTTMQLSKLVPNIEAVVQHVLNVRKQASPSRSVLVAITGIDGCGKGYLTTQLAEALNNGGIHVGVIGIDGWLNLPDKRFNQQNPAEHFYLHALRFEEMFTQLVFPLRDRRSLILDADFAEETATEYRTHRYEFEAIDVILLEGIYLLKQAFQAYYDFSLWIDCSFETALDRAIKRAQEGLSKDETIRAYQSIYFPAQEIHFERDRPQDAATLVLNNGLH